jgi:aspartate 4-decarboxylase
MSTNQEKTEKKCLAPGLTVEQEYKDQQLSPFELKNKLIDEARSSRKHQPAQPFLNAGRGNPNFFNTLARRALCKLTTFALDISPAIEEISLGFFPRTTGGIYQRFNDYFRNDHSREAGFLRDAVEMAVQFYGLDPNDLLGELTDAARGDFYPDPPRMLEHIEIIVKKYLEQIMIKNPENKKKNFDLFATEGGTAGMVYTFKSLMENFILHKKDKVAVITPVFSPYLEIPGLNDFDFQLIPIDASEEEHWQVPPKNLDVLKNPSVKALYLINPTNPTSVALDTETIKRIASIVEVYNHNLVIVIDAVYATFVKNFQSIIDIMPRNCITVYSFSKYFGVTGWRLGTIMLYEDNIIDSVLLPGLPPEEKDILTERYKIASEDVENLKFIDRLVLDSRDVALAHTAGISCPQQAAMALFALFNLMYRDTYKPAVRELLKFRIDNLYQSLTGLMYDDHDYDTHYYALIDILELAENKYSRDLARYINKYFLPVDFVHCLAIDTSSVCLPGYGFFEKETQDDSKITDDDRKHWSIRVSLANLNTDEYLILGRNIMTVLEKYYMSFHDR